MKLSVSIHAALSGTNMTTAQKIRKVAEIGFSAFELWAWWNEDLETLSDEANRNGLEVASICTHFVSLVDPEQRGEYLAGLAKSIEAAQKLHCRYLISQTGNAIPGVSREVQQEVLTIGLGEAAKLLKDTGITLIVEPLNTLVNHPGYYLVAADQAAEIVRNVNSPNVRMLYDVYHQQISEGNLIPTIQKHIDTISYFHIADHPGRHEPGTGEIHYKNVLQAIRNTGYSGYIGLEYFPLHDPESALRNILEQFS